MNLCRFNLPTGSYPGEVAIMRLPSGTKILSVIASQDNHGDVLEVVALADPDSTVAELRYVVVTHTGYRPDVTSLSVEDWDVDEIVSSNDGRDRHVWISHPAG